MELASALPVMVGVLSLVMLSVLETPESLEAMRSSRVGRLQMVSMVTVRAVLVFELPAISVAVAVRLWLPFERERLAVGVMLQMPELLAVVVPRIVVPPPS